MAFYEYDDQFYDRDDFSEWDNSEGEYYGDDEWHDEWYDDGDGMSDVEADADTLRSCGWGTDEDYFADTPLGEEYGG